MTSQAMRSFIWALLLVGCESAPIIEQRDLAVAPNDDAARFAAHDKVDILFMIDNSGIGAMHALLLQHLPDLTAALDAQKTTHPASYHIGVVTSDLGAPGISCGENDGAKLQAIGAAADHGCLPPIGARFIEIDQSSGSTNLPATQDLNATLGCMTSVGVMGCGLEAQLESVYRALHDPIPETVGFLREDALLVVLFLTDEDDCSLPPDSDLGDGSAAAVARYGELSSFRCTRFGIACGNPAMMLPKAQTSASFTNCRPLTQAEGGKPLDVQKYVDYFARSGGVKTDPSDVILASIAAPPTPFAVAVNPASYYAINSCIGPDDGVTCSERLQPSCTNPRGFPFGDRKRSPPRDGIRLTA